VVGVRFVLGCAWCSDARKFYDVEGSGVVLRSSTSSIDFEVESTIPGVGPYNVTSVQCAQMIRWLMLID
jgi:hypothetical protein